MDSSLEVVLLLFFLLSQSASPVAGYYQAVENIAVDCGSTAPDQMVNERLWLADRKTSKSFTLLEPSANKSTASKASHPPGGELKVPYLTARVSHSQFTYSFPVSRGQKFIRLHFYPTDTYPGFETYPALFSVTAGNFTLLSNFTGEPWNPGSSSVGYAREFLVNLGEHEKKLNITFTPSWVVADAYAFVNGVQVVSMPTNLYYPQSRTILPYPIGDSTALELMFRINVGGTSVLPEDDTGMFRNWDSDQEYADNPVFFGATSTDYGINLNFTSNAENYTAPEKVYKTAQAMGSDTANNSIQWAFPVDSGFAYLVRLHFCQLVEAYANPGAQVFNIFVDTYFVEEGADLTKWGGGLGVPLYRDYAVPLEKLEGAQETAKVNLSIELNTTKLLHTAYSAALLNGIEIFKASNHVGDLAGIRFYLSPFIPNSTSRSGLNSDHTSPIYKYVITGGVLIVLCPLLVLFTIRFGKLNKKKMARDEGKKNHDSLSSSGTCRCFSLSEIKAATNNFDQEFIIGLGGFGNVYKGFIDKGATAVAIKRLQQGSDQGANEFRMEIEMLSQLRYLHLVSLIGYCDKNKEMILVYDYMSRGTLRDHLYNTVSPPLPWEQRLRICIGTARGLQYLHSGVKRMTIIHRDVKTTNILLDEKWVAKVSDFGLSKVGPSSSSITHVSTMVKGSFGYLDPEYYYLQRLTQKSDVYSFGVVLCEVLSAKPAIIRSDVDNPVSLAMWFRTSYQRGTLDEIIDPYLIGKIVPECLNKYAELAFHCIAEIGVNRPQMGDVVWGLELALRLQDAANKERVVEMEARGGCSSREEDESEAETESESEAEAEAELAFSGSVVRR